MPGRTLGEQIRAASNAELRRMASEFAYAGDHDAIPLIRLEQKIRAMPAARQKEVRSRTAWGNPKRASKNGTLMLIGALNPAVSEAQRRLFGAALGVKRGTTKKARVSPEAVRLSKLPEKTLRDMARKIVEKNPAKGGLIRDYLMPVNEIPEAADAAFKAKIEKAKKYCEKFHGKPKQLHVYEYDDGSPEVTDVVCFSMGEAEITIDTATDKNGREVEIEPMNIGSVYKAPAGSHKGSKQFVHGYTEDGGKPPIAAIDVDTGIELRLGGTYEARNSEWLRK